MKRFLLSVAVGVLMTAGAAFADAPAGMPSDQAPPPPPPGPQLTADQQARIKAAEDQFRHQRDADLTTLEGQIRGVLTPTQQALWDKQEKAERERQAEFKKGEAMARAQLQKSGQPLPEKGFPMGMGHDGDGPWGPPPGFGPGMMMMRPGPMGMGGGPFMMMHGAHGMKNLEALHLTPVQAGEVHVFHQSFMEKGHREMQAMMQQIHSIAPMMPGRHHHRGQGGPGGPDGTPPPTPSAPQQ